MASRLPRFPWNEYALGALASEWARVEFFATVAVDVGPMKAAVNSTRSLSVQGGECFASPQMVLLLYFSTVYLFLFIYLLVIFESGEAQR